jgi:REP element-mobilizing transposase RayT
VIYRDDEDFAFFVRLFRRVREQEQLRVEAYCLMPNHFHAVIEAELERLSRGIQRLCGLYAQAFNDRYERVGHVFQGRFKAKPVDDASYLGNVCAYVWNNPVRAGLRAEAHHWPWSGKMLGPRVNLG